MVSPSTVKKNCKEDSGDAILDVGSNLPEVLFQLPDQRHPKGPAKLGCFDILSDFFLVLGSQAFKPLSNRFP